ncbi:MAG: hypothetical protein AB1540_04945 [Bdellovibrionota bacterium]
MGTISRLRILCRFMGVISCVWFAWTAHPVPARAQEDLIQSCNQPGQSPHLLPSCSNAWPDPKDYQKKSDRTLKQIRSANCRNLKVIEVKPHLKLAKIACDYSDCALAENAKSSCEATSSFIGWVNLHALSCAPKNVLGYEIPFQPAKPECQATDGYPFETHDLKDSMEASDALKEEILGRALQISNKASERAHADLEVLTVPFERLTHEERYAALRRAHESISSFHSRASSLFGENCDRKLSEKDPAGEAVSELDLVQGARTCVLVKSTQKFIAGLLSEAIDSTPSQTRRIEIGAALERIIAQASQSRSNADYDQLEVKMALLYGLEPSKRAEVIEKLHFRRTATAITSLERHYSGKILSDFEELHNGYVYGGSRLGRASGKGLDCSTFLAELLRGKVKALERPLTSKDFVELAAYLQSNRTGKLREPWSEVLSCFQYIDLSQGQLPGPADVVVTHDGKEGHVRLVKSYDAVSGVLSTIEAAGGRFNTIGFRKVPLFESGCGPDESPYSGRAPLRADMHVLRIVEAPGCPIRLK